MAVENKSLSPWKKTKGALEKHFERLCLAFNFSDSKNLVLDIEEELNNVQTLSKLATLNLQRSEENVMTNIKNALCPLGCIGDHVTFQGSFPVIVTTAFHSSVVPSFTQKHCQSGY